MRGVAEVTPGKTGLPPVLQCFLVVISTLWAASALYAGRFFIAHKGIIAPSTFARVFTDMNVPISLLQWRHEERYFTSGNFNYPTPLVVVYRWFALFNHFAHFDPYFNPADIVFVVVVLLFVGSASFVVWRELQRRGLLRISATALLTLTVVTSWPLFFGVRLANTETFLWFGSAVGVWLFYRERYWASALMFAAVGSCKMYPMLFLLLFLRPLRWKQVCTAVAVFLGINLLSLKYVGPTIPIAWRWSWTAIMLYAREGSFLPLSNHAYGGSEHEVVELGRVLSHPPALWITALMHVYTPVAGGVFLLIYGLRLMRLPFINKVLYITLFIVTFLPKSFDYTLLMLYTPWAMLSLLAVSATLTRRKVPGLTATILCLAFVFAPELFLHWNGYFAAGQYKTFVLLGLMGLALYYPFSDQSVSGDRVDAY